jgi:hypothetical protein
MIRKSSRDVHAAFSGSHSNTERPNQRDYEKNRKERSTQTDSTYKKKSTRENLKMEVLSQK